MAAVDNPDDDALAAAMQKNATGPNSMSADGVSVTSQSLADQIAFDKYRKANEAIEAIGSGDAWFFSVTGRPPGAGGGRIHDC